MLASPTERIRIERVGKAEKGFRFLIDYRNFVSMSGSAQKRPTSIDTFFAELTKEIKPKSASKQAEHYADTETQPFSSESISANKHQQFLKRKRRVISRSSMPSERQKRNLRRWRANYYRKVVKFAKGVTKASESFSEDELNVSRSEDTDEDEDGLAELYFNGEVVVD